MQSILILVKYRNYFVLLGEFVEDIYDVGGEISNFGIYYRDQDGQILIL